MIFFKYTSPVNSGYDNTLTMTILYMYLPDFQKKNECSDKVR